MKNTSELLRKCVICPRRCGIDRMSGKTGYCRAGFNPKIYSYSPHHGEEPPISGSNGSGTIFFSYCNMRCVYCQNYQFSQLDNGEEITIERLAGIMIELQKAGCHNINLVTPTHFMPQIVMALEIAHKIGLHIPIVYNTSGYELSEIIKTLEDVVDIYLVDMRYSDNVMAKRYSDAINYVKTNRESVKEMQRQVGDLVMDDSGIASRGLIIRLLAMPNDISGTIETLGFIKKEISQNAYLSIMSQYHPVFRAKEHEGLARGITAAEYKNIVDEAARLGLNNGWIQEAPDNGDSRFLGTNIKPGREIK